MIRLFALSYLLLACLLVQPQFKSSAQTETLVNVCAADYSRNTIAFDSIVAAFGSQLATATVVASDSDPQTPGIQLPTMLGGVSVRVAGKLAPLFFVSPGQINYLVPPGLRESDLENGAATVEVINGNNVIASGRASIRRVALAFFSFDSSGRGLPAALIVRVKADDSQIIEPLVEATGTPHALRTRLADVSAAGERVFLVLYLSGVRNATDANQDGNVNESIRVRLNEQEVEVYYAGAQRELAGLDQLNVQIPRAFYGEAKLRVTLEWKEQPGSSALTEAPLATPPITNVNWAARGLGNQAVTCIADNTPYLLAGTSTGIFRSTDEGVTWEGQAIAPIVSLFGFWAGTQGYGPLMSFDKGLSWRGENKPPDLSIRNRTFYSFAFIGKFAAGTDQGIYDWFGTRPSGPSFGWARAATPIPEFPVRALAESFSRAFAGTEGRGVFHSNNYGETWTASSQGLPAEAKILALATSAHFSFAIVNDNALYRSSDHGITWERLTNGLPDSVPFTALTSHGRNILVGTRGNGVYLSTDFGATWNAVNIGLTNLNVLSLLVSGTKLYVGTQAGVFVANDALLPSKLPMARPQIVTTAEDLPKAVVLTSSNPITGNASYRFVTAPQNGTLSGTLPNVTYTPRANYNGTDSFTFTVSDGVYTSPPARIDLNITPVNDPPTLTIRGKTNTLTGEISAVEITASDIENNLVSISPTALPANATFIPGDTASYVSWSINTPGSYPLTLTARDNGSESQSMTQTIMLNVTTNPEQTSWTRATLPAFRFLLSLFADASGVYLGLDNGNDNGPIQTSVVRSLDDGNSWPSFSNGLATVNAPQEFASGNGQVYVGTQNGIWRTVNTEAAWTGITDNLPSASKQVWDLAVSGDKVAVAFPNGCYLSLNRGATWSAIRTCDKVAFSGEALFVDAYHYNNGIIREGLFLTLDNGATWQAADSGLQPFKYISRLHGTGNTLCVFSSDLTNERVFCSNDLGRTWKSFSLGGLRNTTLSTFKSETLTAIASSGNTIFLGTNPFGIYVSRDGGNTWLPANLGLPQPLNVRDLWIRGDLLYASSVNFNPPYGGNIFIRKLANE